jgi:hypothetical protein
MLLSVSLHFLTSPIASGVKLMDLGFEPFGTRAGFCREGERGSGIKNVRCGTTAAVLVSDVLWLVSL